MAKPAAAWRKRLVVWICLILLCDATPATFVQIGVPQPTTPSQAAPGATSRSLTITPPQAAPTQAKPSPALELPELRTTPRPTADLALRVTDLADRIRRGCVLDMTAAVQTYGSPTFQTDWTRGITRVFKSQETSWQTFFSSAAVFGGRMDISRAVVIYYNPWSDVALVVGLDLEQETMTEFSIMVGERLRGEPLPEKSDTPAWQADAGRLSLAVGAVFLRTETAVDGLYALEDPYELLPQALKSRLLSRETEMVPVKGRMFWHAAVLQELEKPDPGSSAVGVHKDLETLLGALKAGDKTAFERVVSGAQDPRMTQLIFDLPAVNRSRLSPVFYRSDDRGTVAVLSNPQTPLWFLTVPFFQEDGNLRPASVELNKFSLMRMLLGKPTPKK